MSRRIQIYDTTLRDGAQGEGISFSSADKIRIAERLDAFGIDYIEGGWPGSNPKDMDFFTEAAKRKFKHAKIAAFGSTRRANTKCKDDPQIDMLLKANTPVVTMVGKTWSLHVREVIRTTPEENLAMIGDSVRYLQRARQGSHLRCRALLRRIQGRPALRAGHAQGRAGFGRRHRRALRHQRRHDAGRSRPDHGRSASSR